MSCSGTSSSDADASLRSFFLEATLIGEKGRHQKARPSSCTVRGEENARVSRSLPQARQELLSHRPRGSRGTARSRSKPQALAAQPAMHRPKGEGLSSWRYSGRKAAEQQASCGDCLLGLHRNVAAAVAGPLPGRSPTHGRARQPAGPNPAPVGQEKGLCRMEVRGKRLETPNVSFRQPPLPENGKAAHPRPSDTRRRASE